MMQLDKKKSSYQIELERRSNDLLRVYNPLNEDKVVIWDLRSGGKIFRVPAKQEAVFPRYISEKYIREMYDKILNDKAHDAIIKENQRRIAAGMAAMDKTFKTNEQMVFEQKFYNPNSDEARKIISLLYVGVETEYGIDREYQVQKKEGSREYKDTLKSVQEEKGESTNGRKTTPDASSETTESIYKCDTCGFIAKGKIGLFSHRRTHREELEKAIK